MKKNQIKEANEMNYMDVDPTNVIDDDVYLIKDAIKNNYNIYVNAFDGHEKYDYNEIRQEYDVYKYSEEGSDWHLSSEISKEKLEKELIYIVESGKFAYTVQDLGNGIRIEYTYDLNNNPWEYEDEDIDESTMTGASSGSYQTPFKMENNLIEITENQFKNIVKNVLLKEFVYSSPAGSTTNTNTKSKPTKSTVKQSMKASEANMKPNMEDKRPANVKNINDQGKQKEEEQIEREAGGQQDLEFDSLSDKAKANFKKQFTAGDKPEIGNASDPDSTVGEDMLKRAKKRKKSKDDATLNISTLGSDMEFNPSGKVKQKSTMAESSVHTTDNAIYKKYTLKNNAFLTEEFIDEHLTQYNKFYKGKTFFLEDSYGNRAKINWLKRIPILESIIDIKKEKNYLSLQEKLFKADAQTDEIDLNLNENEVFHQIYKNIKPRI